MWWFILAIAVCFLAVHAAKMIRLYLVLMEHKIGFSRFLLLYLKTTFVNLLIPFKAGEIYRIFAIGRESGVWQVGILSVLIDRFFDIAALLLVLLPLDVIFYGDISFITWIFLAIIVIIACIYLSIEPTYQYLNKYIIKEKNSGRSMAVLKGLDVVNNWYEFTKNLVQGRFALIFLASFAGWVFEILALKALAGFLAVPFGIGSFSQYIKSIFLAGESRIASTYTLVGAGVFLLLSIVGQLVYIIRKKKDKEP
ncbi:MAG: hypothetical protein HDR01_07395 [Lachnospiraceae bacterium]|nr:hypothetical protein [Lachnospiraceae bacterium]